VLAQLCEEPKLKKHLQQFALRVAEYAREHPPTLTKRWWEYEEQLRRENGPRWWDPDDQK